MTGRHFRPVDQEMSTKIISDSSHSSPSPLSPLPATRTPPPYSAPPWNGRRTLALRRPCRALYPPRMEPNPERPRLSIEHAWTTLPFEHAWATHRPRGPPTRREDHPAHVPTARGHPSPAPQPSEAFITGASVPGLSSLHPEQAFFIPRAFIYSRLISFPRVFPKGSSKGFPKGRYGRGGANWGHTLDSVGGALVARGGAGRPEAVD